MMQFKPEQLNHFKSLEYHNFLDRVVTFLCDCYPEFCVDREPMVVRTFVAKAVMRAASYDVISEAPVARFVEFCVLLGSSFDAEVEYAWMFRILKCAERDESSKIADIDRLQFGIDETLQ